MREHFLQKTEMVIEREWFFRLFCVKTFLRFHFLNSEPGAN